MLISGRRLNPRRFFRALLLAAAAASTACATLPLDIHHDLSHAWASPETSALWREWGGPLAEHAGQSGFLLLPEGLEAFTTRAELADRAEHTLDVQYYMIHPDDTGKLLLAGLVAAADRGVRVRLLVDDMYALRSDQEVEDLDQHPNLEIRIFNPWRWRNNKVAQALESLIDHGRINHRMHNKLFVADNAALVMGGRNLGDEYFQLDPNLDFRDLDVFAVGPIAREASRVFDDFWNSPWAVPIGDRKDLFPTKPNLQRMRSELTANRVDMENSPYAKAIAASAVTRALHAGTLPLVYATASIVADPPDKVESGGTHMRSSFMLARFDAKVPPPKKELLISTPYFVPSHGATKLLTAMVARGVDVRVLTIYLANDAPPCTAATRRPDTCCARDRLYELKRANRVPRSKSVQKLGFGSTSASCHQAFVTRELML